MIIMPYRLCNYMVYHAYMHTAGLNRLSQLESALTSNLSFV